MNRILMHFSIAAVMAIALVSPSLAADAWEPIVKDSTTKIYRWTSTCNSYVIKRNDRAIVIDLGDGSVLDQLAEIGIEHVDWVLFTHHHREQSQGIAKVDRQSTRIAAPHAERDLFENPLSFRKWFPTLGDKHSVYGASYVRPSREPIPLDRRLRSEEPFQWDGLQIECLDTPGNSPGSMTFLLSIDTKQVAFSGGLMHQGSKMVTWFDSEWDYGFAKGIDVLLESTEKLLERERGLDLLLPAQGPAVEQPSEELAAYRDKLTRFRAKYIRGYPVFGMPNEARDPISTPTQVAGLSQVTPHLFKLTDATRGWNFSIIISDQGRGLILDCGLLPQETLEELILGMREHLGLKSIDAFWISHMHGDHFLLGPWLRKEFGASSWTLDRIVDKIENPRHYDYAALVSAYGDGFDGMPIDRAFSDGESIEWDGYRIQIDWMPGQTEFGCCLWLDIDGKRIAFTGDNLFGDPTDREQDGHEAVVARNSCIFEEGYLYGSRYLLELKPDIVMGSHSYVMPDPAEFIARYHRWAADIIERFKNLLPDEQYEYLFDPYWVSAYPYRVDLAEEQVQVVEVTVRNFRPRQQRHHIILRPPPGVILEPAVLNGTVAAKSRATFEITLRRDVSFAAPNRIEMVTFDIELDGKHYGEWFDFLVRFDE